MEISHGMSFHLVWDLTIVRPTNRTSPPPPPFFFFFYLYVVCAADSALLQHGAKSTVALQISYYMCARTHARAHKAYLYIDGT